MANYVRYVDPDAAAGGNGSTNGLSGASCAFQTLALAEGAGGALNQPPLDLAGGGHTYTIICGSNAPAHTAELVTGPTTINGWTTSATSWLLVTTDAASRAGTAWSDSKYRIETATSGMTILAINRGIGGFITVDGLQVRIKSDLAGASTFCFTCSDGGTIVVKNCHMRIDYTGSTLACSIGFAATAYSQAGTVSLINNVFINRSTYNNTNNRLINNNSANVTMRVYSCTGKLAGRYGLMQSAGTVVAKNSYFGGATSGCYSGTIAKTNCASSDTTADGTAPQQSIAFNTTNFTNVTGGSEDVALPLGSALIGVGADLSGETAPLNLATDINGDPRGAPWDIGADEYYVAPPAGPAGIKSKDGVLVAGIKTADGVAIADAKTVQGAS